MAIAVAADEGRVLKASVTAPAESGRANEALLQLLARAWHVPRRDLSIVGGVDEPQQGGTRRPAIRNS